VVQLTNLPFVFAVWAPRRGIEGHRAVSSEAKDFGMDTLDHIISSRPGDLDFADYLTWHVHFHLARMNGAGWRILRAVVSTRPGAGPRSALRPLTGACPAQGVPMDQSM
jgi:hypothetical protein